MSNTNYDQFFTYYSDLEPPDWYQEQDSSPKFNSSILNDLFSNIQLETDDIELKYPGLSNPFLNEESNQEKQNNNNFQLYYPTQFDTYYPRTGTGTGTGTGTKLSRTEYVSMMYNALYKALSKNGIDADEWTPTLITHTAIESGWGNEFSRRNNNFGGMKGKGSGLVETKEWDKDRGYYTIKDEFKSFSSVDAFADEYVKKLKNKFHAFDGTPEDYLKNIRKHGYFTAPLSDYEEMFKPRLKEVNNILSTL